MGGVNNKNIDIIGHTNYRVFIALQFHIYKLYVLTHFDIIVLESI